MSASEAAQLLRQLHTAEPTAQMHEELVRMARRRLTRATEKVEADKREQDHASLALDRALHAQAEFAKAHPDPQQAIFP